MGLKKHESTVVSSLLGKKVLQNPDIEIETVLIDVSECPIQRPKKKKLKTARMFKSTTTSRKKRSTL